MPITLNKAVEILELNLFDSSAKMPPDCKAAVILAINGLKAWKQLREGSAGPIDLLLPGEEHEPPCPN